MTSAKVPVIDGFIPESKKLKKKKKITMLTDKNHNWTLPLEGGPGDVGFQYSYMSPAGIQSVPFAFFRNDYLSSKEYRLWYPGSYAMPHGISMILDGRYGEGAADWDSTAYNMIVVNETIGFLDHHMESQASNPFFAYVALSAVHIPHSPPDRYIDGTPIAGEYLTKHMDVLGEVDKVIESLTQALEDLNLLNDTIVIFASDNGGLSNKLGSPHYSSSGPVLRGSKGQIYEGGHRIPLIMRWDGGSFPSGAKRSSVLGLSDLYATLCDLVGVNVPDGQAIDSVSFADYIYNGKDTKKLRKYLGVWLHLKGKAQGSIRKKQYKLIYDYKADKKGPERQFYNLDKDLSESKNLCKKKKCKKKKYKKLMDKMYRELQRIGPKAALPTTRPSTNPTAEP